MSAFQSAKISYELKDVNISNINETVEKWEELSWRGTFSASSRLPKLTACIEHYFGEKPKSYLKVSEQEKINRVRIFMAYVRNMASFEIQHANAKEAFKCLSRPMSRADSQRGIPVGGFGNDEGFLTLFFEQVAKNVEEFPYSNKQSMVPWSHIISASMGASLFNDTSSSIAVGSFWHLKPPTASFGTISFFDNDYNILDVPEIMKLNPENTRFDYKMPLGLTEEGVYLETLKRFLSLISHCVKNEINQKAQNPLCFLQTQLLYSSSNLEKLDASIQETMMELLENSFKPKVLFDDNANLLNKFHPMGTTILNIFSQIDRDGWSIEMKERLLNVCKDIKVFESSCSSTDEKYLTYFRSSDKDLFPQKELLEYFLEHDKVLKPSNKNTFNKGLNL